MSKVGINEIEINGEKYVRKDSIQNNELADKIDGMPYVIIRTYSAGVHAGYLKEKEGKEVVLKNARRIWYWAGAASLSQLAMDGTSKPDECKFPCAVNEIALQWIEIIPCTEKAMKSITGVKIWKE